MVQKIRGKAGISGDPNGARKKEGSPKKVVRKREPGAWPQKKWGVKGKGRVRDWKKIEPRGRKTTTQKSWFPPLKSSREECKTWSGKKLPKPLTTDTKPPRR